MKKQPNDKAQVTMIYQIGGATLTVFRALFIKRLKKRQLKKPVTNGIANFLVSHVHDT